MWIFTPYGLFMPSIRPPWSVAAGDTKTLQVRARVVAHLQNLKEIMGDDLGEIVLTPTYDYEARVYVEPEKFAAVIAKGITEIDYERFKPTTARYPRTDKAYHSMLNGIWSHLFATVSTREHQNAYARGASVEDIYAAAGTRDITIPPSALPVKWNPGKYKLPRGGKATPGKRGNPRRSDNRIDLTPQGWDPYSGDTADESFVTDPDKYWEDYRDKYWADKSTAELVLSTVEGLFSDSTDPVDPVEFDWQPEENWGPSLTVEQVMEAAEITSRRGKKNFRRWVREVFYVDDPAFFEHEIPNLITSYQNARGQQHG